MRPLRIAIPEYDDEDTEIMNTEPGVQSNLNISIMSHNSPEERTIPIIKVDKIRSVSDSRAPALEELLHRDNRSQRSHRSGSTYHSSTHTIPLPPLSKMDVF